LEDSIGKQQNKELRKEKKEVNSDMRQKLCMTENRSKMAPEESYRSKFKGP